MKNVYSAISPTRKDAKVKRRSGGAAGESREAEEGARNRMTQVTEGPERIMSIVMRIGMEWVLKGPRGRG